MWIKCTKRDGKPLLVNLDTIVRIERNDDDTMTRMYVCAVAPDGMLGRFDVKEKLEQIEQKTRTRTRPLAE
jgi:hypothetical protein